MRITQIKRIKEKIALAKQKDKKKEVFGSNSHKYKIKKKISEETVLAFEKKYNINLPEGYRLFKTEIGNEGNKIPGYSNDKCSAGPYYGIYPLEKNVNELLENSLEYLGKPFKLYREEEWDELTNNLPEDDKAYEIARDELHTGVLPIGTMGCSGVIGLILNEEHCGKIIYLNLDLFYPTFTNTYFLDWYEDWLDEIIQSEEFLNKLLEFLKSDDELVVLKALHSLSKFKKIEDLNNIKDLIHHSNLEISYNSLALLANQNYKFIQSYLLELIESKDDNKTLSALKILYINIKKKKYLKRWTEVIKTRIESTNSVELLKFGFYILSKVKADNFELLHKLVKSENEEIRKTAYYNIGQLKDNSTFDNTLKEALSKENKDISITVLQAIGKLNSDIYIPHYKAILKRLPNETFIISNVKSLLKELGTNTFDNEIQNFILAYFDSINNDDDFDNSCNLHNILLDFARIPLPKLLEYAKNNIYDKEIFEDAKETLESF